MKRIVFCIVAGILVSQTYARTGVQEALRQPSAVTELVLSGEKNEAALLTKHASEFSSLAHIVISGVNDSLTAEQDVMAVAAVSSCRELTWENSSLQQLTGAFGMLGNVKTVNVKNAATLNIASAFVTFSTMPSLQQLNYEGSLVALPKSLVRLRGLHEVSLRNTDLSLADSYQLNTHAPEELLVSKSLELGFGNAALQLSYSCYDATFAAEHLSLMRDLLQGVAFPGNALTLPSRPVVFHKQHPLVRPPVKGLDVATSAYTTNAAIGGMIEYPSGTRIIIPPNAFVDANGNTIHGTVTIGYREFRDPVDILVSGIPMKYDTAGHPGDFESAGMFEMNASVNGREVFLAPGKKIDLDFAVVDTASSYNFYRLDEQKGWQYLSGPGKTEALATQAAPTQTITTQASSAVLAFQQLLLKSMRDEPYLGDTITFEKRYADTMYFSSFGSKYKRPVVYSAQAVRNEWKSATHWRMQKVYSEKGTNCFQLWSCGRSFFWYNTEMTYFRNTTFQFNDPIDKATFAKLRSSRSGICDLRLDYEGGNRFTMELKFPDGFQSYSVSAVHMDGKKPVPYSENFCASQFRRYSRTLTHRQTRMNRDISRNVANHSKWATQAGADSLNSWNAVKNQMNTSEQAMDFAGWSNYTRRFNGFRFYQVNEATQEQSSAVYQALQIMNFGVYNCDQIRRINNPVQVYAWADTPDSTRRDVTQMFVIVPGRNQAFSYTGEQGQPVQIAFGKNDPSKLLAIHTDGSVSYCDENSFGKYTTDRTGDVHFITNDFSGKPVTPQQLRELIYPEQLAKK